MPPRRLHLTLGVMALTNPTSANLAEGNTDPIQSRTLDDAVRFLENLKPRLDNLLRIPTPGPAGQVQKTRVVLDAMDTMKLGKDGAAHVLWVGPKVGNSEDIANEETNRLRRACGELYSLFQRTCRKWVIQSSPRSDLIHNSFKRAGFLVEESHPLKVRSFILFAFKVYNLS